MMRNSTKKLLYKNLLVIFATILFFSCQKDLSFEGEGITGNVPSTDLSTKISSSVSGFVTDENDTPVMGASVQFGSSNITTDKYGYFEANNVQVVKNAAVVTVTRPGYFKGIKTYIAAEGKSAFFRIKLIPKTIAGTVNAAAGGTVTLSNGLNIKLPAGGIVNAATNTVYTGTVNVTAYWINPTAADLPNIMPGDLRGITTDNAIKLLQTFGMAAVELTGSAGELLQLENGKKATLTMPIPAALIATAPASIPLWYFDEAKGLWKEEGSATKTGSSYTGDVSHFSFWNYDKFFNPVSFSCTVVNSNGQPVQNAFVKISIVNLPLTAVSGYTDRTGFIQGDVPANQQLLIEVFGDISCLNTSYSQTITSTNNPISLGNINIPASSAASTVTGTVTNCNNAPVTNGYVIVQTGSVINRYNLNNAGVFSFTKALCGGTSSASLKFIGVDETNSQESNTLTHTVTAGNNIIPAISACGISTVEYFNYSVNGTPYTYSTPADTLHNYYSAFTWYTVYAERKPQTVNTNCYFNFTTAGIGVGSAQTLNYFSVPQIPDTTAAGNLGIVNITESGVTGQYIAGNFSGIITRNSVPYNIVFQFRIKRNF